MATIEAPRDVESYIRDAATARGIDPDVAVRVARSEGLGGSWQSNYVKNGVREDSFGPFQLKETGGLGALFEKRTGLDVRDKKNVKAQIDFALDHAAKNGWGAWYGAAKVGVGKWTGLKGAQAIGQTPTYAPPQNTSDPFEAQPGVGIAGHAYEGLLGSASPGDGLLGTQSAPQLAGGTAQDTLSRWAAGQDFGAKQQAAQRDYEAKRQMSANSAPAAAPSPSRFGGLLDAPTPGVSPERYGTTTQDMALAHLMSEQPSFDPSPNQQFASAGATQGAFQSPSSTINKMVDGMMNTPSAVAEQPADTAPDPAAVAALQGTPAPPSQTANIAPGLIDTPQLGFAPTGAGFMPGMEAPRSFTPWGAALDAPMSAAAQQTVPDPSATQDQTISYPEQPEQPSQLDAAMASPAMKKVKDVLGLLNPMAQARGLLGDPIGKLAGLLGGPAGVSTANIDAGSGMHAMEQGMYGERGTFGRSLSNPGAFSVSRGPNQGYDLHNAQGVVTPYDSSGHIMANRDTMRAWGGLLDHLFGGGLLDRPDKDKDKSRGGPVGGYSGNGLY